jgi:hypothetical protein
MDAVDADLATRCSRAPVRRLGPGAGLAHIEPPRISLLGDDPENFGGTLARIRSSASKLIGLTGRPGVGRGRRFTG